MKLFFSPSSLFFVQKKEESKKVHPVPGYHHTDFYFLIVLLIFVVFHDQVHAIRYRYFLPMDMVLVEVERFFAFANF